MPKSTTSKEARDHLLSALRLDLIGPRPGDLAHAHEELPSSPSSYYLTGFLVPFEAQAQQELDYDSEGLDEQPKHPAGDDDVPVEHHSARRTRLPSSMGLTAVVAPDADTVEVTVRWGDYAPQGANEEARAADVPWKRTPRELSETLSLAGARGQVTLKEELEGLHLRWNVRELPTDLGVAPGTRTLSVFLVNERHADVEFPDKSFVFQPELTIACDVPFEPRPDLLGVRVLRPRPAARRAPCDGSPSARRARWRVAHSGRSGFAVGTVAA